MALFLIRVRNKDILIDSYLTSQRFVSSEKISDPYCALTLTQCEMNNTAQTRYPICHIIRESKTKRKVKKRYDQITKSLNGKSKSSIFSAQKNKTIS